MPPMSQTNMKLYVTVLGMIFAAFVLAAIGDLLLYFTGQPTVTAFLRENTKYFWLPAKLVVAGLILLMVHLFVVPEIVSLWNQKP